MKKITIYIAIICFSSNIIWGQPPQTFQDAVGELPGQVQEEMQAKLEYKWLFLIGELNQYIILDFNNIPPCTKISIVSYLNPINEPTKIIVYNSFLAKEFSLSFGDSQIPIIYSANEPPYAYLTNASHPIIVGYVQANPTVECGEDKKNNRIYQTLSNEAYKRMQNALTIAGNLSKEKVGDLGEWKSQNIETPLRQIQDSINQVAKYERNCKIERNDLLREGRALAEQIGTQRAKVQSENEHLTKSKQSFDEIDDKIKSLQKILNQPSPEPCNCPDVHGTDWHIMNDLYKCETYKYRIPCDDDIRCRTKREIEKLKAQKREGENNYSSKSDEIDNHVQVLNHAHSKLNDINDQLKNLNCEFYTNQVSSLQQKKKNTEGVLKSTNDKIKEFNNFYSEYEHSIKTLYELEIGIYASLSKGTKDINLYNLNNKYQFLLGKLKESEELNLVFQNSSYPNNPISNFESQQKK